MKKEAEIFSSSFMFFPSRSGLYSCLDGTLCCVRRHSAQDGEGKLDLSEMSEEVKDWMG